MIKAPRLPQLEARGWELRWQLTMIEPAATVETIPGVDQLPPPRTNIVLSRTQTEASNPEAAMRHFLDQTKPIVPGLHVPEDAIRPVTFSDGASGFRTEIEFPAAQEIRLWQLHLFRIDAGVTTQIVLTCDTVRDRKEREALEILALGFVPEINLGELPRAKSS